MKRERPIEPQSVRAVRAGHGANCSSIGSVIDTLFATATVGAAVFAAVVAAMRKEDVKVVGASATESEPDSRTEPKPEAGP